MPHLTHPFYLYLKLQRWWYLYSSLPSPSPLSHSLTMVVPYRRIRRVTDMHDPGMTMTMAPRVITIAEGEDVKRELMLFSQGHRATVVLSCHGTVSAVNFARPRPDGMLTHNGRFTILSLVGSFMQNANAPHGVDGDLNVSLETPDGQVMDGRVEEFMTAATPVQVVMGIF